MSILFTLRNVEMIVKYYARWFINCYGYGPVQPLYPPMMLRNESWCCRRELIEKYSEEVVNLGEKLMKILSLNLGLRENYLSEAFGGDDNGACLRVNYYPKCPQPDLTLGISSHSDPGGMTLLNPDENVSGLQVRHGAIWLTVNPLPNAFIINIGDQLEVLSSSCFFLSTNFKWCSFCFVQSIFPIINSPMNSNAWRVKIIGLGSSRVHYGICPMNQNTFQPHWTMLQ